MSLDQDITLPFYQDVTCPRLRPGIDFTVSQHENGDPCLIMQDKLGLDNHQLLISPDLIYIIQYMNGKHSLKTLADAYLSQFGQAIEPRQLSDLVAMLDEYYLLDTPRYHTQMNNILVQFRQADTRPAACAGNSYPASAAGLTAFMDSLFTTPPPVTQDVTALVVPHIDLRLGGPTFSAAYSVLKTAPLADLYVVLGIGHAGLQNHFTLTELDFDTPLGPVRTDSQLVKSIMDKANYDYMQDELVHRDEHSVEFQAVILKYLLGDVNILPVLCSFSPGAISDPASRTKKKFDDFTSALASALSDYSGRVRFIAGVDFAHIGPRYDESHVMDNEFIEDTQRNDRELLDALANWDVQRFQSIMLTNNDRYHVCGYSALYTLLNLLPAHRGHLLDYRTATMDHTGSRVTFAGMVF